MNSTAPINPELRQAIRDEEHLKLLRIGFFVAAGTKVLMALIGLLYAGMGVVIAITTANARVPAGQHAPPAEFRWFFFLFGVCILLVGSGLVVLNLMVARRLRQRRSRVFCIVVAAIGCIFIPYGTLLGVLAMLVLCRPSVTALFEAGSAAGDSSKKPADFSQPDVPPPVAAPAAPPALGPQNSVAETGDATGGIIPYKNPHALVAYYCGIFSLIPCLGIILGPIAVAFGVSGLRARKRRPAVRGLAHAWTAIFLGSIVIVAHVLAGVALVHSVRAERSRAAAVRFESRAHPRH